MRWEICRLLPLGGPQAAHASARLNRHGRHLLIERVVVQHWPVAHAAKAMGISRQCASRWRAEGEGRAGRSVLTTALQPDPNGSGAGAGDRRRPEKHRRGPAWIAARHTVCARAASRVLVRHELPRLDASDPDRRRRDPFPEDDHGLLGETVPASDPHGREEHWQDPGADGWRATAALPPSSTNTRRSRSATITSIS